jgi:septum formation protein
MEMLRKLSGKTHAVITGVCLRTEANLIGFSEKTEVKFRVLTQEEMEYYVHKYKPLDKAGAYGIQEWIGSIGVTSIRGCYYNVMGLPIAKLYFELGKL